ncbi:MAG: prepilin-type N-terminal cleavage/methylation domain-containing protein [Akkermansia sp.]|nr:prepilin-type N-terminal cleavage/methylation domain-containing protein [Akkermansia sp.]
MKLHHSLRHAAGFTLIELMVVIAIMVTLAGIAGTAIYSHMGVGDEAKCRAHLEQLVQLGTKYSQDISHSGLLPTSGMDDDEDTDTVDESEGWWISVAPELDAVVFPRQMGGKMKVSSIFHCPADKRVEIGADSTFAADVNSVSYVSWTDASDDPENPNSCIRTTAKQNLDVLPWLSDGKPVKGESVTDVTTFKKQVMSTAERHNGKILVAYASGAVKVFEMDEDTKPETLFKKIAPDIARKAGKDKKKGKKSRRVEEDDDEE